MIQQSEQDFGTRMNPKESTGTRTNTLIIKNDPKTLSRNFLEGVCPQTSDQVNTFKV